MGELFWGGIMPYDQPLKKGCPTNGYRTYNPTEMMENWRGNCRKDPEAHGLRNCAEISMLFAVPSSQRPGGTPLSGRRAPRRPPTGADWANGGPNRPMRESTLGIGSTLQRVSDDMVGRHVVEGRASKAGTLERDEESGAQVLTSRWKSTSCDTWGQWPMGQTPSIAKPRRSAVAREAIEERKLGEMYLQCNNYKEAKRHLAQASQLMSLAEDSELGLNAHSNVGQRGYPSNAAQGPRPSGHNT